MLSLSRKALLIALGTGTAVGGIGAVGIRVATQYLVTLPDDAVLLSVDGATVATMDESGTTTGTKSSTSRRSKKGWLDPILRRNVFDSTKVGQFSTSTQDEGDAGTRTSLPLVLLATVVSEPPKYSSALIQEDGGSDGASGYGIGDEIMDEATVHRIEQRRVILKRSDGALEYLEMDDAAVKKTKKGKKGKKGKWGGIEKAGDNKFTVDEDTFNKALENPEKLANSIRAVPHTDSDGKIDGYRLSGVRRSSLFNKLGIRNGDVVHSVNGNTLDSMQNAMEAYNSLQGERDFNFEVTRRGKRNTFEYEVR
jgi:general secretion pathway protein C